MTREEIEKRITELGNEIILLRQSVEEDLTPTPPHPKPEPKQGDMYYYIATDGTIISKAWYDVPRDHDYRAFGNVFYTGDAARYASERMKVLAEMSEWAGTWDDQWRIAYNNGDIKASPVFMYNEISYGDVRFATEANAKNCIKAVGEDRLKKYYFQIGNNKIPMPDCCCCSS